MKKEDCIFCKLANGEIPTNTLFEDDVVRVIFDAAPAAQGHVLVMPKEHFDDVFSMDTQTAAHVFMVATRVAKALKQELNCEGMNLLQNNGKVAGQTVFHFHLHIIPRNEGDGIDVKWNPGTASQDVIDKLIKDLQGKI